MRLEVVSDGGWGAAVATELADRLRASPRLRLCLPTGSTPQPLYAALVQAVAAGRASFRDAQIFLLDEYLGLSPRHPARCESMLRSELIEHVDLPPGSFHPIDVDDGHPEAAATTFDEQIERAGGLDLALLGLGANGHVGMNEPGSGATDATRVVDLAPSTRESSRAYGAEVPPERGVTVGLGRLLAAGEVWLLVRGAHKAAILARTLSGPVSDDVPATHLLAHRNLTVFADEAAAGDLRRSSAADGDSRE